MQRVSGADVSSPGVHVDRQRAGSRVVLFVSNGYFRGPGGKRADLGSLPEDVQGQYVATVYRSRVERETANRGGAVEGVYAFYAGVDAAASSDDADLIVRSRARSSSLLHG